MGQDLNISERNDLFETVTNVDAHVVTNIPKINNSLYLKIPIDMLKTSTNISTTDQLDKELETETFIIQETSSGTGVKNQLNANENNLPNYIFWDFLIKENIIDENALKDLILNAQLKNISIFKQLLERLKGKEQRGLLEKIAVLKSCRYFTKEEILSFIRFPQDADTEIFFRNNVLPLKPVWEKKEIDSQIHLICDDPFDLYKRDIMSMYLPNNKLIWHIGRPSVIQDIIKQQKLNIEIERKEDLEVIDFTEERAQQLSYHLENVNIPEMLNWFLFKSIDSRASDIHVEPGEKSLIVRFRVDGVLQDEATLPIKMHPEFSSRIKILSQMNVAEKRLPQDGRFEVNIKNNPIDLRVSTFPTIHGEKVVMRLLNKNALRPSLEDIGLVDKDVETFKKCLGRPFGMIIVSGPTGSGKSTTLYSALTTLPLDKLNVVTVEDPVEYRLPGVHQLQVKENIGLTFASSLKTILRQDPDVILIGEIRDKETAEIAVRAALTGHIVLSTLHTNDAIGIVARLLDIGIEPFLLSTALTIGLSQRLVRKICDECRVTITADEVIYKLEEKHIIEKQWKDLGIEINNEYQYEWGSGCNLCHNTGYFGRQAIVELFEVDENVQQIISERPFNDAKLDSLLVKQGMTKLLRHGINLVDQGMTTIEEIIRVIGEH